MRISDWSSDVCSSDLPSRKDSAPPNGYVLDDVPDSMADPGGINPKTGRLRVNISAANDAPSPPAGSTVDPIVAPTLSWKPRPMLEPANDRDDTAAGPIRPADVLPFPSKQGTLTPPRPEPPPAA